MSAKASSVPVEGDFVTGEVISMFARGDCPATSTARTRAEGDGDLRRLGWVGLGYTRANMTHSNPSGASPWSRVATVLGIVVVLLMFYAYRETPNIVCWWSGEADLSKRGQFGDQFGAFNALASTFTVVAVVASIWLQRSQHRAEIAASRAQHDAEMRAEKKRHEDQMADAERKHLAQMREASRSRDLDRLFRLLDRRVKAETELRWTKADGTTITGVDAVRYLQWVIRLGLESADPIKSDLANDVKIFAFRKDEIKFSRPNTHAELRARYDFLFRISQDKLAEYLRTITSIAKTAARAKQDGDEALVETSLQWLTLDDLKLLGMHRLKDQELSRDLDVLAWEADFKSQMMWTGTQS